MSESHTESVAEVFCHVLETLAFMFGEPAERDTAALPDEPCLHASIGFKGPSHGTLSLIAPMSVATELSANVLGLEADDPAAVEQANDALGELMNVTLGQLITAVAGMKAVFDLTPPQVAPAEAQQWNQMAEDEHAVAVLIDDKPVLLRFSADS